MLLYRGEEKNIVSELNKNAGFYSQYFFLINHYLYCKKHRFNFTIKSDIWLFKSVNGWSDYFKPISLSYHDNTNDVVNLSHTAIIEDYNIREYINIIPEIYVYNDVTNGHINEYKKQMNLINYDSIFIRRGDKLATESEYYEEEIYLNLLLFKNPNCDTIFLQTDDYTCYLKLEELIKIKNLNIRLLTLCNKENVGFIVKNELRYQLYITNKNKNYLDSIRQQLLNSKSVQDMNSEEIYDHTVKMIIGVDICMKSNICVCDYQSNVSRFIKLSHNNPDNVYDILNQQVDYNKCICPASGF
jgi:hypothetical protein